MLRCCARAALPVLVAVPLFAADDAARRLIPDDAALVVAVPKLSALTDSVSGFVAQCGLERAPRVNPAHLLEWVHLGTGEDLAGIDIDGPLIFVLPSNTSGPLLIVRLTDPPAWQRASGATEQKEGLLALPRCAGFAAIRSGFLLQAEERDAIEAAVDSKCQFARRLEREADPLLPDAHLLVFVNVPSWSANIKMLGALFEHGVAANYAGGDANKGAAAGFTWFVRGVLRLCDDTDSLAVAARFEPEGLRLAQRLRIRPDTPSSNYVRQLKKSDKPLLRGLPDDPYAAVIAYEWGLPPDAEPLSSAFSEIMLKLSLADDPKHKDALDEFVRRTRETARVSDGVCTGVGLPPGQRGLTICAANYTSKPAVLREHTREFFRMGPELFSVFGMDASSNTSRTETVAGCESNVYTIHYRTADARAQSMLEALYGESATLYIGTRGDDVVSCQAPDPAAREAFARLLAEDRPPLAKNPRVEAALKPLPPQPQACILLDLGKALDLVSRMTEAGGMPFPRIKPPDGELPLIAATMYLEPDGLRQDVFIPAEPIAATVRTIRSTMGGAGEQPRQEPPREP